MRQSGLKLTLIGALGVLTAACGMTPESEAAAIEEELFATPGGEELFGAIKADYPDDLANLVAQLQAVPIALRTEEKGQEIGAAWLQEFMARIAPDAVRAPAEQLLIWSETEAELYETLQRSEIEACANMTMGSWVFIDDANSVARAAIQRRNTAMIRSAAAGRSDPQEYGEPTEAQFNQLGDAIAETGLDPEVQATLGMLPEMQALPVEQQCELGVAYYKGIAALPDDIEPTVAAYMFAPE